MHSVNVCANRESFHHSEVESGIRRNFPVVGHIFPREIKKTARGILPAVSVFMVELHGPGVGDHATPDDAGARIANSGVGKQTVLNTFAGGEKRDWSI